MKIPRNLISEEVKLVRQTILQEGNMSYCRFENTANALQDCIYNWGSTTLSESEQQAKSVIFGYAEQIIEMGADYKEDEEEDDEFDIPSSY